MKTSASALGAVLQAVRAVATAWVVICFIVMTVSVWAEVGGRYIFNYSIAASSELATMAQIWMVLVGAGLAARQDLHARVDALVNLLPRPVQRAMLLIGSGLGLVFLMSIVVGAVPIFERGLAQTTPSLGLPMAVPYAGLFVGPIYFAVEVVALTVRQWRGETVAPVVAEHTL
ncbi:TRAP transporter small permease [Hydrogenophaga sp.]|uniref:TRAP transporter small permease n=1 Tax=Hydrogenophaga sp. TaxID=1904254 RepID=UPI00263511FC|nr:TRAP transporter small permease [Hydrogenophaga sp.]MCW5655819.1 TRAP transporter small permease [Hydrogenophaga sp.]